MLSRIDLKYFKCFETLKLPLRPLTLLSGENASGKSTLLQALVLIHQTMCEHEWSSRLMLNGASVSLGTAADVIDQEYGSRFFSILLIDEDDLFEWEFQGNQNEMSLGIQRSRGETRAYGHWDLTSDEITMLRCLMPQNAGDHSLVDRIRRLTYLSAERLGPREYYSFQDPQLTPVVGVRGEFTVSVLHSGKDLPVLRQLCISELPPIRFHQVQAWMAMFFPGCRLNVDAVLKTNNVTLGLRTSNATDFHRPIHTGFGLTQVLPIVVAALSARKNDIILIENPEVHLHPACQAIMGEFLARASSAGVQIIVETHSDHVLNGIRRAIKRKLVTDDDVGIHFFRSRNSEDRAREPQVLSPAVDADGNIDSWPSGFFDQFDKDLRFFAGWD